VFDYSDLDRNDLPNNEYMLDIQDVSDYVNQNIGKLSKGVGVADYFENQKELVKIDEPLKNELINIYSKDKTFAKELGGIEETTGAASSGAFTGPMTTNQSLGKPSTEIKSIEETTAAGGTPQSSSTGQYTQPAIWAKDKKNWKGAAKTQYPNGEMVDIDTCTKLNNNKSAQNGKCCQGAVDNVVKTHKTNGSVISKSIYETIAKKTGRSVTDVMNIIETKIINNKPL
jgi:hypothetical protein